MNEKKYIIQEEMLLDSEEILAEKLANFYSTFNLSRHEISNRMVCKSQNYL